MPISFKVEDVMQKFYVMLISLFNFILLHFFHHFTSHISSFPNHLSLSLSLSLSPIYLSIYIYIYGKRSIIDRG